MSLPAIADISDTLIKSSSETLRGILQARFTTLDFTPGTVNDQVLVGATGLLYSAIATELQRLDAAYSLYDIQQDPTLADADKVDRLLSNYGVSRRGGAAASGQITIVTEGNNYLAINTATTFLVNDLVFLPITAYSGVPTLDDVVDDTTDLLFQALGDNKFAITIAVQAQATGAAGNVAQGTQFSISPTPSAAVIEAYAAGEFSGGLDTETNAGLIARMKSGIASQTPSSRVSLRAMLTSAFTQIVDMSIIGAGDIEMQRGSQNTLGIKVPGYVDVYVRTQAKAAIDLVSVTATCIDTATSLWTASLSASTYPGVYKLRVISGGQELAVETVTRAVDPTAASDIDYSPELPGTSGVYTRYQSTTFSFIDPRKVGTAVLGATDTYSVEITYMPYLIAVNDWLLARARRPVGSHYVVRAPIPCFTAVNCKVLRSRDAQPVTTATIGEWQQAVADAVNATTFATGRLDASRLVHALHKVMPDGYRISLPLDLQGTILFPSGVSRTLISREALQAPTIPLESVSPRTVAFFATAATVSIQVVPDQALPV